MIALILRIVAGLLVIGGISLAIHEMNVMMDSMTPATQGVVLVPMNTR
ncbi:hypothetical protein [Thiomonas sp. X19]|nr:hypothetical protein [Thiomonas sp. X19]